MKSLLGFPNQAEGKVEEAGGSKKLFNLHQIEAQDLQGHVRSSLFTQQICVENMQFNIIISVSVNVYNQ